MGEVETCKEIRLFHGSDVAVYNPDLIHSREFLDFGKGFYLTKDNVMARKWAATKKPSILTTYSVDFADLECYTFQADSEWLQFVVSNRKNVPITKDYSEYDVLIGPTADDKLFNALADYVEGGLSEEVTIKIINGMHFSNQYLFRTEKALGRINYVDSKKLSGEELQDIKERVRDDRINGSKLYISLKQQYLGGTYYGQ